ncbi:MAG: hypothetical protein JOY80_10445 [Candidatus Dormibacteraeota bacterium]|nr:hypothetical protein [Candidatus Dormibacteraeota bacterium]
MQRALQRLARIHRRHLLVRFTAIYPPLSFPHGFLAAVQDGFPCVHGTLALVGEALALVGQTFARIGDTVALVSCPSAHVSRTRCSSGVGGAWSVTSSPVAQITRLDARG